MCICRISFFPVTRRNSWPRGIRMIQACITMTTDPRCDLPRWELRSPKIPGRARGFDSIVDLPNCAGGLFSFWNREGIRLLGSGVLLTTPGSLIPSLRASKEEGQANFVNSGIFLANAGADFDIAPKLKGFVN